MSDKELLSAVGADIGPTNTLNTAHLLLHQAASIGAYREHLTDKLLYEVLYPLWYTGFSKPDQVIQWLNYHLTHVPPLAPFDLTNGRAVAWIRKVTTEPERIQGVLDQIAEKEDSFTAEEIGDGFLSKSAISPERIRFRSYWSDNMIREVSPGILYFLWEETAVKIFHHLTAALSQDDPNGILKLFVVDYPAWVPLSIEGENSDPQERGKYPAQVVWVLNNQIIHNAFVGNDNLAVLSQYTTDLMQRLG